ncbi:MAG: hypothetical protein ACRECT_06305 [Thermoplasmata archaeon]
MAGPSAPLREPSRPFSGVGSRPGEPLSEFEHAIDEFEEATSGDLDAVRRLNRVAWATFLSVPLGSVGIEFLAIGFVTAPTPFGAGIQLFAFVGGGVLCGAVAVILVVAFAPPWSRRRTAAPSPAPGGLGRVIDQLVRMRLEVDQMRRRASDTVLLVALALIFTGGFAASLVQVLDPGLPFGDALLLSGGALGGVAIVWAILYWTAIVHRANAMENRVRALTSGLAQLEDQLWSRF